mmetsp:Transcript_63507/g.206297  ORF Transcript_63507/g.206297 Transcript_63507/m.206297 type:complete len:408 (+) Transcript_63507:14-1237(+)
MQRPVAPSPRRLVAPPMADYANSPALPSAEELGKIAQIRAACKAGLEVLTCKADDVVGDLRLCRFLRSRHGDVKEATEWYQEFLKWRLESGMDVDRQQVVGRSPENMLEWWRARSNPYLPICPYGGRNKDGHVLWFMYQGRLDPKKFIEHRQVSKEEDLKSIYLVLEWMLWHIDTLSRQEQRMVYVVKVADFNGMGSEGRKLPIFVPEMKAFLMEMLKGMQKFYCEHDACFLLVNTPFAFRMIFSVLKYVLTKRQASKMRVLGDSSQADVLANLKLYVPEDRMPTLYGGPVQALPGMFPFKTEAEIATWYQGRHLLPVELADAIAQPAGAAGAGGSAAAKPLEPEFVHAAAAAGASAQVTAPASAALATPVMPLPIVKQEAVVEGVEAQKLPDDSSPGGWLCCAAAA